MHDTTRAGRRLKETLADSKSCDGQSNAGIDKFDIAQNTL
jgi:hypothetical protein